MTERQHDPVRTLWTEPELDDALAALHADTGTPDLGRARAALATALAAESTGTTTGGAVSGGRPARPGGPVPVTRRRRWPYAVVAAGVAAAAVAGIVVAGVGRTGPDGGGAPDRPASYELTTAADHTTGGTDPRPGPGQYLFVENTVRAIGQATEAPGDFAWRTTERTRTWVPADESGTWVQDNRRIAGPEWLVGDAAQARSRKVGTEGSPQGRVSARCGDFLAVYAGQRASCERGADWKQPTTAWLRTLPTDPKKLLDTMLDGQQLSPDTEQYVLQRAWLLLQTGVVPADVRSTIYRSLALLPDLKVTDRYATLDGRQGTALGITADGMRDDIVVDPASGRYIGFRMVLTEKSRAGVPAGTVYDSGALRVAVVDAVGATR